jgi:twitching motility protein PilT
MLLDFEALLRLAVEHNASDIHLKVGSSPMLRVDGRLERVADCDALRGSDIFAIIERIASEAFRKRFQETMELDTSYMLKDVARFRVNACIDDGKPRVVMRTVPLHIKSLEELGLPPILTRLCTLRNGLILFTGPTGSGKSTSLAAMVDRINSTRTDHIVTIEDPLEFVHVNKAGIITQR